MPRRPPEFFTNSPRAEPTSGFEAATIWAARRASDGTGFVPKPVDGARYHNSTAATGGPPSVCTIAVVPVASWRTLTFEPRLGNAPPDLAEPVTATSTAARIENLPRLMTGPLYPLRRVPARCWAGGVADARRAAGRARPASA